MIDTPRTDAAAWREHQQSVVDANFARELERELAAAKAEVGDLKTRLDTAWGDVGAMQGIVARLTAERDEARREVCLTYGPFAEVLAAAERRGWDCFEKEVTQ